MKMNDVLNLIFVILSLSPFLAIGYYFGRQDKRITLIEHKVDKHENILFRN